MFILGQILIIIFLHICTISIIELNKLIVFLLFQLQFYLILMLFFFLDISKD